MDQQNTEMKLFAGTSNPPLAEEISRYLDMTLGKAVVETFSDGETKVEIKENVRGADVFVLQSTSAPENNNLMELLLMLDAFKRASAKRITAVIPYYGYARQDRKVVPRVPDQMPGSANGGYSDLTHYAGGANKLVLINIINLV